MHNPALRVLLCACAFATTPVYATSHFSPENVSRQAVVEYNRMQPVAGFQTVEALSEDWQRVDIYFVANPSIDLPNGRPWIEYVARRSAGKAAEGGSISWTSSRDCPALFNTLVWLTTLVAPRVEIPGVTPSEAEPAGRRPVTIFADGLQTTVWGHGTQPDYTAYTRVEISSNGGLIAEFGQAANTNLGACWASEEPKL